MEMYRDYPDESPDEIELPALPKAKKRNAAAPKVKMPGTQREAPRIFTGRHVPLEELFSDPVYAPRVPPGGRRWG